MTNGAPITAIFEDGVVTRFEARPNETVYAAAVRAGVRLEHDCLEGACGTCKTLCTSGEFVLLDYVEEALSAAERAVGYTLSCQMQARSACVIELPYPASNAALKQPAAWIDARVAAIEPVASNVIRLVLEMPTAGGASSAFLPGQYAHLEVPGANAIRYYSYANAPGATTREFFVRVLDAGAMTEYLRGAARAGDTVRIREPYGHFYLRPITRAVLMVAGGTGLAPMLAMLRSLDASAHSIRLLYGTNDAAEQFASDALDALAAKLPLTIERQAGGFISDRIDAACAHAEASQLEAYLCGPPPMIDAASAKLAARGVPRERIHAERFVPTN